MKKSINQIVKSGAVLLALSLAFTSCDELIGELDNLAPQTPQSPSKTAGTISFDEASFLKGSKDPAFTNALTLTGDGAVSYESSNSAVATVDATGKVTIVGAGTTTIKAKVSDTDATTYATNEASYTIEVKSGYSYKKWDKDLAEYVTDVFDGVLMTDATWSESKYVVDGTVNISSDIILTNDVEIFLCDGAKLKINGKIDGDSYNLTIYSQSFGADMGQLEAEYNKDYTITAKSLSVYGGKLDVQGNGSLSRNAFDLCADSYVYGGEVFAKSGEYDYGIKMNGNTLFVGADAKVEAKGADCTNAGEGIGGNLNISGRAVVNATAGISDTSYGGSGISGTVTIGDDAQLTATGGDGASGDPAIYGSVTISGRAIVKATGGKGTTGQGDFGIKGTVTIGDDAQLTAIGGEGTIGEKGIFGNVTISGRAIVTATGGKGTADHGNSGIGGTVIIGDNAQLEVTAGEGTSGEPGIFGNVTISGRAIVTATGGKGTSTKGGNGINGSVTIKDAAKLTAIGGNGYSERGGNGISGTVVISDNADLTAKSGNTGNSETVSVISGDINYYGGTFTFIQGTGGGVGVIVGTLTNKTATSQTFQCCNDGTSWSAVLNLDANGEAYDSNSDWSVRAIRKQ